MSSDKVETKLQSKWPFKTDVWDLQSTAPKGSERLLAMQPWPKPIIPHQTQHPSMSLRVRGLRNRVTTCVKDN
jgi:hypothetical protein